MYIQTSRLFRFTNDTRFWIGYTPQTGYVKFPVGIDGWKRRTPLPESELINIHEVPLHLAFHTGFPVSDETVNVWTAQAKSSSAA